MYLAGCCVWKALGTQINILLDVEHLWEQSTEYIWLDIRRPPQSDASMFAEANDQLDRASRKPSISYPSETHNENKEETTASCAPNIHPLPAV
jgi:hypothetical protein